MAIIQYLKDTQQELRHVAWPTRTQTVVYTILVATVSIIVSLYLGLFDFLFTTTLARFVGVAPATPTEQVVPTTGETPEFDITTTAVPVNEAQ